MIRVAWFHDQCTRRQEIETDQLQEALRDPDTVVWLDFSGEPPERCEPLLLDLLRFHPLAVDDALQETHIPKIDDWGDYLYIVLETVAWDRRRLDIAPVELDVFLGRNYLVTHHDLQVPSLERVWNSAGRDHRNPHGGPAHLLYKLTDEMVVTYMQVVEEMDEEVEAAEDLALERPAPDVANRLVDLKRATLHLRRSLSPLREVLNRLARDQYAVIDPHDRIYFRDVYDHLVRLHDIAETLRDLTGGALEVYLSVLNNRMNDVMKTLTVITTLFMPISFVVGFFGMNFFAPIADRFQPWTDIYAFLLTLFAILAMPLLMLRWMRRRGWL